MIDPADINPSWMDAKPAEFRAPAELKQKERAKQVAGPIGNPKAGGTNGNSIPVLALAITGSTLTASIINVVYK